MRAHDVTPANEPQTNGTKEVWTGNQEGVGPCSPDRRRPSKWRKPSYSRKYSAVPDVSRTRITWSKKPVTERRHTLTQMKPKPCVQTCYTVRSEDVPHGLKGARRSHKLNAFTSCDCVFQLPSNLP